jgi:hypothetical protein
VQPLPCKLRRDSVSADFLVPVPDLLGKACLAKKLTDFGKTFAGGSSTRFGFLLGACGAIRPIYTYPRLNSSNISIILKYIRYIIVLIDLIKLII